MVTCGSQTPDTKYPKSFSLDRRERNHQGTSKKWRLSTTLFRSSEIYLNRPRLLFT
ncbi:hypothetical protein M3J09_012854 [Ascochyta lentis]